MESTIYKGLDLENIKTISNYQTFIPNVNIMIEPKVLCKPHYGNSHLEMVVWKQGTPHKGVVYDFFKKISFQISVLI